MANSSYQIATSPKLFISWPLYEYAQGVTNVSLYDYNFEDYNDEFDYNSNIIKTLHLDPSKWVDLNINSNDNTEAHWRYKGFRDSNDDWWNFDFFGVLNHNFNYGNVSVRLESSDSLGENITELTTSNIVNHNPAGYPEYDGWSLMSINDFPSDSSQVDLDIYFTKTEDAYNTAADLGSIFWGKSYEFPQNTELNTSVKFSYGINQQKTISGKTLSSADWYRTNAWANGQIEPFGLSHYGTNAQDSGVAWDRKTGIRTWTMEFTSLAPDKVMPQNMMMNDNNYTLQDNHEEGAVDGSSKYNIKNSPDFYSRVVRPLMSNHLPCVLQIDKNDNSPSGFAIVRLNRDFVIKQVSSNLYSIKCSFTEQI